MNPVAQKVVQPEAAAPQIELPASLLYDQRFLFNRELSWLEFNRRVLEEAADAAHPLLERLKFLAIFSTNLDEFFMIRVSGLKEQIEEGVNDLSPDGMSPHEQLRRIREILQPLLDEQMRLLNDEIMPALAAEDIAISAYDQLSKDERLRADAYFTEYVFPVLTPQAVDASHPFPYVSNLSVNVGVVLVPDGTKKSKHYNHETRFARVKLPTNVGRLVPVNDQETKFTLLGELIKANIGALFPGMRAVQSHLFRVTRDADIELREEEASDLLDTMERELRRRRFGAAVRLEVSATMPDDLVQFLTGEVELEATDVYRINGFLNIPDLMRLYSIDRPHLKDRPLAAVAPPQLRSKKRSIFDQIGQEDVLVHHPFTSYSTITDFINAAANDPDVQAIKICLYRTGKDSPIVAALVKASENGKQVAALVELKARFDEENNIEWARRLEHEGVHVVYGLRGLKTHSKLALVVRREAGKLRRYVHVATGNYNPTTARIYTDLGILTANEEIGADATDIFNFLTGYSNQSEFRRLLVAPVNLREKMLQLIEREIEHKRAGRAARIVAKMNSLTDLEMIAALYRAAQAGVRIDLIIRGICMLRPGVPGLSENIQVRSVVGRFLEHSRIFYFKNGGGKDAEIFIGSADWMHRNLDRRVEVVAPILSNKIKKYIKETVLEAYLRDNTSARVLQPDGGYQRVAPNDGEESFAVQDYFAGK